MTELAGTEAQLEYEPLDDVDAAERLPAEIEPAILRKYFSLTRADLDEVERSRGPANKLGFSVQLCTLRWRGHFLPDTRDVPPVVLEVLAPQLGLLPMLLADYPRDEKTRFSHLERIRRHLRFVRTSREECDTFSPAWSTLRVTMPSGGRVTTRSSLPSAGAKSRGLFQRVRPRGLPRPL